MSVLYHTKRLSSTPANGQLTIDNEARSATVAAGNTQFRNAKALRDAVIELKATQASARDFGIVNGTDAATVTVVPENLWNDGMTAAAQTAGLPVTYFTGKLQVQTKSGTELVNGARTDSGIFIRADDPRSTAEQLIQKYMDGGTENATGQTGADHLSDGGRVYNEPDAGAVRGVQPATETGRGTPAETQSKQAVAGAGDYVTQNGKRITANEINGGIVSENPILAPESPPETTRAAAEEYTRRMGGATAIDNGQWTIDNEDGNTKTTTRTDGAVYFVEGAMNVGTTKRRINGYSAANGVIFVQANDTKYTGEQLLKHEIYHQTIGNMALETVELRAASARFIESQFSDAEFERLAGIYVARYSPVYEELGMTASEIKEAVFEEILADADAGMNRCDKPMPDGIKSVADSMANAVASSRAARIGNGELRNEKGELGGTANTREAEVRAEAEALLQKIEPKTKRFDVKNTVDDIMYDAYMNHSYASDYIRDRAFVNKMKRNFEYASDPVAAAYLDAKLREQALKNKNKNEKSRDTAIDNEDGESGVATTGTDTAAKYSLQNT
jgi:hypothetical protein